MLNLTKKYANFLIFIICTFICSLGVAAQQTLWQKASYGMSVDQVRAVVPNATLLSLQSNDHLNDGSVGLLKLNNLEIVNNKFTAIFYFTDKKLTQVTLTLNGQHSFDSAMDVFYSLAEIFRIKYGRELSLKIKKGLVNMANANWFFNGTNINLIVMGVGNNDALLNINYQVRLSKEADKL